MGAMDARDPQQWVDEPLRRALDGVLYRWLALFCAPVAAAVIHKAVGSDQINDAVHLCLPVFLTGYIVVHLVGRLFWHGSQPADGWIRASQTDRGTVALTRTIGWVALVGAGAGHRSRLLARCMSRGSSLWRCCSGSRSTSRSTAWPCG